MRVADHHLAWLKAIALKRGLPVHPEDGTGRDAHLPPHAAKRLSSLGLIAMTPDRRRWVLTDNARTAIKGR